MTTLRLSLLILALAAIGLAGGFALNHWLGDTSATTTEVGPRSGHTATVPNPAPMPIADADRVGKLRPAFTLPDLQNRPTRIAKWDGNVVMINFWASWCPPCRREMPGLIKLYHQYHKKGFTLVGVAIDNKRSVQNFIDPLGLDYPILIGGVKAISVAKQYGDHLGILPYTVLIGRDGRIVSTHPGELSYAAAEALIKPLL